MNNSPLNKLIQIGLHAQNKNIRILSRQAQKELYNIIEQPNKHEKTIFNVLEDFESGIIESEKEIIGIRGAIHIFETIEQDDQTGLQIRATGHFINEWNRTGALNYINDMLLGDEHEVSENSEDDT